MPVRLQWCFEFHFVSSYVYFLADYDDVMVFGESRFLDFWNPNVAWTHPTVIAMNRTYNFTCFMKFSCFECQSVSLKMCVFEVFTHTVGLCEHKFLDFWNPNIAWMRSISVAMNCTYNFTFVMEFSCFGSHSMSLAMYFFEVFAHTMGFSENSFLDFWHPNFPRTCPNVVLMNCPHNFTISMEFWCSESQFLLSYVQFCRFSEKIRCTGFYAKSVCVKSKVFVGPRKIRFQETPHERTCGWVLLVHSSPEYRCLE
jgi:hypothetical protein